MAEILNKLNVSIVGNMKSGRSMLFVHGFGTDQTVWKSIVPAFSDDYRIILFDNMGSGGSDTSKFVQHRYLDLEGYACDLEELCRTLQLRETVLVGHSVGCMIGVLAHLRAPRHFSRLVLIGASPCYRTEGDYCGGFSDYDIDSIYQMVTLRFSDWADSFAAQTMGNIERPQLAAQFAESLKSLELNHALTMLCAIFQSDHRVDVARLDKPTLIIQAKDDAAVPREVAEFLRRRIAGSTLRIIDATGHFPHVSAPGQVIAAMTDFLAGP